MTTMASVDDREWIPRMLDLPALVAKRSHFLFGPRQTGKTSLVRRRSGTRRSTTSSTFRVSGAQPAPGTDRRGAGPRDRIVVIDEIQRLPDLLNEVHRLIENAGRALPPDRIERAQAATRRRQPARRPSPHAISPSADLAGARRPLRSRPRHGAGHCCPRSTSPTTRAPTSRPTPASTSNRRSSPRERRATSPPSAASSGSRRSATAPS